VRLFIFFAKETWLMTKRSTIGTNPLDEVIQNPLEATISDQHGGTKQSTHQEEKKQGSVGSSAGEHQVANPVLHHRDVGTQNPQASKEAGPKGKAQIHQEDVSQTRQPEIEVLPPSGKLEERLSELEEENICLKWALGLILAPLALLAILG
jgi:hypothetical protein